MVFTFRRVCNIKQSKLDSTTDSKRLTSSSAKSKLCSQLNHRMLPLRPGNWVVITAEGLMLFPPLDLSVDAQSISMEPWWSTWVTTVVTEQSLAFLPLSQVDVKVLLWLSPRRPPSNVRVARQQKLSSSLTRLTTGIIMRHIQITIWRSLTLVALSPSVLRSVA